MSFPCGAIFGIQVMQELGLKRLGGTDTFENIEFNKEDMECIKGAVIKLEAELNKRCWRLKTIEVGF